MKLYVPIPVAMRLPQPAAGIVRPPTTFYTGAGLPALGNSTGLGKKESETICRTGDMLLALRDLFH